MDSNQYLQVSYSDDGTARYGISGISFDGRSGFAQTITTKGATVKGDKIAVVCNGQQFDFDTLEQAQTKAEELAHQQNANAFILKPIKKVAPKRDVVTTDLI